MIPRQKRDPNQYFNLVYNLKQRGRNIVTYVDKAEKLYKAYPANLMAFLPYQFVAGLDNKSKINMVQLYLNGKKPITFPKTKEAVMKSYQQIRQPSLFDTYNKPESPAQSTALQTKVNADLLVFFNELKIQNQSQKLKPVSQYHAPPLTKANPSLLLVTNQNFLPPGQEINEAFHKRIWYHNCIEESHYLTSCPRLKVSYKQRELNKAQIKKLKAGLGATNKATSLNKPVITAYRQP